MRTDIWREGTWVDLWSVVHLLSGLLIGLFFYYIGLHAVAGVVVALVALTAYELFEVLAKIQESPTNRFMDVVVGMMGYVPAFFLVTLVISGSHLVLTFGLLLLLTVAMSIVGWRASQKAAVFEKRFLAKLASSRSRLLERDAQFRAIYRERRAHDIERKNRVDNTGVIHKNSDRNQPVNWTTNPRAGIRTS